jgi:hypothetical protein
VVPDTAPSHLSRCTAQEIEQQMMGDERFSLLVIRMGANPIIPMDGMVRPIDNDETDSRDYGR